MHNAPVWKFLETYKELIINTLDLLSFCFVTPEFIRVAKGRFEFFLLILYIFCFCAAVNVIGNMLIFPWQDAHPDRSLIVDLLVAILWGLGAALSFQWGIFAIASLLESEWLSRNLAIFGIVLFFASRILALTISMHGAH